MRPELYSAGRGPFRLAALFSILSIPFTAHRRGAAHARRLAALVPLLGLFATASHAQEAYNEPYVTNGSVVATVLSDDGQTLYLGGSFTYVGPNTGAGVRLSETDGSVLAGDLFVDGEVLASVPDGAGGFYIGGGFTRVGGVPRDRLAHILADGSLDLDFDPGVSGPVRALTVDGGVLYVGGDFTSVGGQTRNRIAALDTGTGQVTAFDPSANGTVRTLATDGGVLYVGGSYTAIDGQTRRRLAAVDTGTGQLTPFDPDADGPVFALATDGGVLYVGGGFTSIGGQTRNRFAALDTGTGLATPLDLNVNGTVNALFLDGGLLYAGGAFTFIGGVVRARLAALDTGTGLVTAFDPNMSGPVLALAVGDGVLYAGGTFNSANGATQVRRRIAAVDTGTGQVTPFDPDADGPVRALALGGGVLYAGGDFAAIGGQVRNRIAAIDTGTGQVTPFDPNANGSVFALALDGDVLYTGGSFNVIGGQLRGRLAALDTGTGQATDFESDANGTVNSLAVNDGVLYVGGFFIDVGGQRRDRIAAVDTDTGELTPFDPRANGAVFELVVDGGVLYVGGAFVSIGGQARRSLAAFNIGTGQLTSLNPNIGDTVYAIALDGDVVYVGGQFTSVDGQTRNRLAAFDTGTGQLTPFDPNADDRIFDLIVEGRVIYAAGDFTAIDGQARSGLAVLGTVTGQVTPFDPNIGGTVRALALDSDVVYATGSFATVGGETRQGIAAFDAVRAVASSEPEGWRMLSAPIDGLTVGDLTDINLVSGIPGDPSCAAADGNLFTGYVGDAGANGTTDGYTAPASYAEALASGRGFLWYFYDAAGDAGPCGAGETASSVQPLPLTLSASGSPSETDVTTTFTAAERAANEDTFYLAGNPFAEGIDLEGDISGLTTITGADADGAVAFQNTVQIWDAGAGGYVTRTAQADSGTDGSGGSASADDLSVWQGVWLERSAAASPSYPLTLTYDADSRTGEQDPDIFVGRTGGAVTNVRTLRFEVTGTVGDDEEPVFDGAASILFADGATAAWDAYDASKLGAFSEPYTLIGPVGQGRDGALTTKAAESRPFDAIGTLDIPLAFSTSADGAFQLRWREIATLPAEWGLTVFDAERNRTTDMRAADRYVFTSDATDGATDRFTVTIATMTVDTEDALVGGFRIGPAYPNPARGRATVSIEVAAAQTVRAEVLNVLGQRVATVFDGQVVPGTSVPVTVETDGLAAGSYVVRVVGETFAETRRVTVVR